ncbi:MAG: ABC transporter ATP-binding protein [Leptolyngbyaceae bacterium]|nr:ABC transporter ATP-binding protein [Leptolyngbyaceae bacterium]
MSSDEILVTVNGVSKKYCRELRRSLRYGLQDVASELFLQHKPTKELRRKEFWALQDVNFELKRGESFGIIGVNGSGKTTLLKIMQGLLKPTTGTVTMRGRVGALITLGQGFQPVLSGRENIFINAAILGVSKAEVLDRMDDILAFADLGEFIDAPVKTYSSGMKGRLGFSIATNLISPDVLLLDEVLATGDWKFKERCFQRMEEIVSSGATIVFVSHLVPKVERLCNRVMLLHKGVVKAVGPSSDVCEEYYALPDTSDGSTVKSTKKRFVQAVKQSPDDLSESSSQEDEAMEEEELIEIHQIELLNPEGQTQPQVKTLDPLMVRVTYSAHPSTQKLNVIVQFLMMGDEITIAGMEHQLVVSEINRSTSTNVLDCVVSHIPMKAGKYRVSVTISEIIDEDDTRDASPFKTSDLVNLTVNRNPELTQTEKRSPGIVYVPATWRFDGSPDDSHPQQTDASFMSPELPQGTLP